MYCFRLPIKVIKNEFVSQVCGINKVSLNNSHQWARQLSISYICCKKRRSPEEKVRLSFFLYSEKPLDSGNFSVLWAKGEGSRYNKIVKKYVLLIIILLRFYCTSFPSSFATALYSSWCKQFPSQISSKFGSAI